MVLGVVCVSGCLDLLCWLYWLVDGCLLVGWVWLIGWALVWVGLLLFEWLGWFADGLRRIDCGFVDLFGLRRNVGFVDLMCLFAILIDFGLDSFSWILLCF